MSRKAQASSIAALLFVLACLAPVDAASVTSFSLDRLVYASDEIVIGRVAGNEVRWEGRLIVTVSTIDVDEALKGDRTSRLEVAQPGGTAVHPATGLRVRMTASSHAALRPGEEVLLFLRRTRAGRRQLVGAQQGKLAIREDRATGYRELPGAPRRLRVFRDGDGERVRAEAMTLDEMRERIRSRVERGSR